MTKSKRNNKEHKTISSKDFIFKDQQYYIEIISSPDGASADKYAEKSPDKIPGGKTHIILFLIS